ncbi:hypothetical protein [Oceanobacillus damuensis]|uniref:hypothetical protein n=1 Tax=Oceanobacillus damuensis TaxID=937928 RepID=UPI00082CDF2B|nr:hypothetical protein [Oceanobacillus damuensis]
MQRILYNRKFWLPVIVLLISLISIFLYRNIGTIASNWFDTLKITIGVIGLVTTLFNYWKKFNLFVTKIWIILTNSTAIWNVSSNFEGEFDKENFKRAINEIRKGNQVSDYFEVSETMVKLTVNGLNYNFEYVDIENDEGTGVIGKVYCNIVDFNSSYDYSIKAFGENIIPYFSIIEKNLRPDVTTFNFKIKFRGKNPFIRLITKNVDLKTISSLWYSIQETTTAGKRNIKITDKSIECTTSNITDFQNSSINFISLVGE